MGDVGRSIASIAVAIVGLAILAVLVSNNSNTTALAGAVLGGFKDSISAAVAPVSQGSNH